LLKNVFLIGTNLLNGKSDIKMLILAGKFKKGITVYKKV
jgi:hypothetical protein